MALAYNQIAVNKRQSWVIVALFPITFAILGYLAIILYHWLSFKFMSPKQLAQIEELAYPLTPLYHMTNEMALWLIPIVIGIAVIWMIISYFTGASMMINNANATEISQNSNRQFYQLVENLCITRNLPMPKIYVMQDTALNSFATGRNSRHAAIVVTSGLLNALEKPELQAVIAHELAHIENGDISLMLLVVEGITFFTFIGESLFKSDGLSGNFMRQMRSIHGINGLTYILGPLVALLVTAVLMFVGVIFIIFGGLIAPILRFAISRQQEFTADATAALMTRNPGALASALEKIAQNPKARILCRNSSMSLMCIYSPREIAMSLLNRLSGLYASHPPIAERIAKLKAMDAAISTRKANPV